MELDDELCLCFHVTKRKVRNYLRVEKPKTASQLSDCYGAGTGCGWCRKMLERMFQQSRLAEAGASGDLAAAEPSAEEYARSRADYVRSGGGSPPPGATPIDPT